MEHCSSEEANEAKTSTASENNEESETFPVCGDQRVWVKPVEVLFNDEIKEEIPDIEYQTVVEVKDEIEEEEIEALEIKVDPESVPELPEPPPSIEIPLPKVAIPKLHKAISLKKMTRKTRNRKILPMTKPIAPASTSHVEQAPHQTPLQTSHPTSHQIIMPSSQMPGIAYQIFLGDHSKNSTNPVQYTMLQPQPVFLQQTPTSVSSASQVVMSQPSMVISQPFQMTQAQIQTSTKMPQIAPKVVTRSRKSSCTFCYKLFYNLDAHLKECWLNPDSKRYKFRKIAPSTF